jgi:protein-S-isoprenylcysteine O-methyltransferase Ste14
MIFTQIIGCGIFAASSIILAILLSKYPSAKVRVITTLILHHIGLFAFLLPLVIGIFYPGITSYDRILGIPSLPYRSLAVTIGVLLTPISIFYIFTSWLGIIGLGHGHPGLDLTKKMVDELVYKTSRNPMSLGFYAGCLALGFLAGSTYFTLWTLIEIIPCHILYLKIFEELELEMRFGQSYIEYKKHTPFLIPNIRNIGANKSINQMR